MALVDQKSVSDTVSFQRQCFKLVWFEFQRSAYFAESLIGESSMSVSRLTLIVPVATLAPL